MRRIHKLVSNSSRKLQSMMGDHKSARKSSRRVMNELFMEMAPLEERVLMATTIISSTQMSVDGADPIPLTYDLTDQDSITINSGVSITTNGTSFSLAAPNITFNSNVSVFTGGGEITITGKSLTVGGKISNVNHRKNLISVGQNVTFNTNNSSGAAGAIELTSPSISIGSNSRIQASGANSTQDGAITISAESENNLTFGVNAWMQIEDIVTGQLFGKDNSATVDVGTGTQIVGGVVSVQATSGNPLKWQNLTNLFGSIANAGFALAGRPNLLSLPIAIQYWSPKSEITFGANSQVFSSSTINVNATSESNAIGKASWFESVDQGFGFAVGLFFTDATANVTVAQGADLQASGNITVASNVTNTIELEAMSIQNRGISPTNPNAVNISAGIGSLITNSVINVQAGSSVISQSGQVNLGATATDTNKVKVKGKTYRDGLATISFGTVLTDANVQVIVNGTVSAGYSVEDVVDATPLIFNPATTVDFANSQLKFTSNVPYSTGQQLVFDSVDSGTIPGLVPGETYFAIVNAAQPSNLQLATTQANALSGVNIQFGAAYPTLTIGNYNLPITLIDNAYSNSILFSYDSIDDLPILSAGDNTTVTYTPAPGRFIGYNDANGNLIGALPAGTYKIKQMQWPAGSMQSELYPLAIQLIDSQNQTVVLNTNSYFTTSDGTNYQVASFDSESSLVDFNFEQPSTDSTSGLTPLPVPNQQVNLANGAALIYTAGLNNPIENLLSGQTYYAEVDPSQSGVIQLATTLAQSQAANPSVQDALPYLKTVNNQACIESTITGDLENSNGDATSPVLTLESDNSYQLYNSAISGTFQLTINGPEGDLTTVALAFNASATQVESALNSLAGIEATVTGAGTSQNPWVISILFNFEIGNFQNGTELTFNNNPNLADGTAVVFLGVQGKPVPGLVTGQTYYAFNQTNPDFISQFPQYIMTLKASDNASADDIVVDLTQSMTDANGQTYSIGYQDAEEGLISLYLPQVTAPLAVDGSGLTGGQVFGNQLTAPALVLYSVADSGSFTLSLTDAGGTTQTTAPIAWNATATDVQTALNTLTGINATVVGTGIFTSPWTISGIDPGVSVSDDTSSLLYEGAQTALIKDVAYANTQQVWLGGAMGGTFTVTLNYGSNQLITAALPYNASTQQFAQAINALGFQASVTGSGTTTDPWQFMAYYNPMSTGQALTFNDVWNSNSLGMLNGQTYYAVTSATQYNAGEVMLSLSASASNATASPPVLLDMQGYLQLQDTTSGLMSSPKMGLAAVPISSGVIISAKLKSKDAVTDMAKTGGYPPLKGLITKLKGGDPYDVYGVVKNPDKVKSNLLQEISKAGGWDKSSKKIQNEYTKIRKNFGGDPSNPDGLPSNPIEASLGLAVLDVKNNSQVIIGSQAQIFSAANVKLSSNITEQFHAQADAGVSRKSPSKSESGNLATALGLAVSILDETSQVIVQPNASINAAGKVNISSYVQYPFAWKATTISQVKQANELENSSNGTYPGLNNGQKAWAGIGITSAILTQALTGSGAGMGNWLFNSSSNSYTVQAKDDKIHTLLGTAIGGSVNIVDITNNNLAQICDGAQINQGAKFTTASSQGVSLTAVTTMDQVSAAGQMKFLLNAAGVVTMHPLDVSKSSNVIGGSVNVASMDNSTQALIGGNAPEKGNSTASPANGPTRINYGNYGLTSNASTDIMYISLSQSGGLASGFGLEASVAVIKINSQNTTAAILSAANAPVILNMANTTGSISIKASDNTTLTPSSGGLLIGKAINLGFSSSEAVLNRNVSAFIGNADPTAIVPAESWPVIQSGGNITIQAIATGKIVPASLAGSVINKGANETGNEVPGNPGSHFGFGVSGDYSEAKVVDSVTAGINGGNLTGVSNQKAIGILAINETRLNLSTGAASLQFERGRDSAVGLAGSASYSDFTSNVWAGVKNADITAFKVGLLAQNNKTIGTFAAGLAGGSVAGVGIEVAGSVAINHVTNDTVAEIANTTGRNLGTVDVKAFETDDIWAAAGTVTFVTSFGSAAELAAGKLKTKVGFGFGFAQNLLDSTTHAIINNSDLKQTGGILSLAAEQASRSFVLSAGMVFEAGKGMGITPYGMVALNEYTNADVQALVENSSITSTSTDSSAGMLIASQLIPIMITAAGDLGLSIAYKTGVGAEASIGAGVSVTEVSITGNSVASVSNSNITLNRGDLKVTAYTGQSANATDLNNTLTNLNLPPGNYNLYSLAIAGGLTTAIAPEGELAIGVDGVGAGIGSSTSINTLANITDNSQINLLGNNGSNGSLTVEALENLTVYDDAGGASVSIQTSMDISIGIAVGIGAGVHNSTNSAIASVTDSNVTTAGNVTVSAESSSNITGIGFGVALDVSISEAAGLSLGISASSATVKIVSDYTISAYISGGLIDSTGSVAVTSTDNSQFQTVAVSGSLSVSYGTLGGVALAAGASVSRIEPSHTISAYIGSTNANTPPQTIVLADGPILVEATNNQHLTAQTIAVASSIAISGAGSLGAAAAGAGARITLNNTIKSGVLSGTKVTSSLGLGKTAITVDAIDNGNITSTVGSGALNVSLSLDPYGCIGGSLGISISEITNNDIVVAQVEGANITTLGGDVVVQALGNNTHFSESVATSVSVSLISVAGAGGNSNIYDNSNFTASVDSGSSIVTGNSATGYGSLSVLAETSETVMAQMFGGAGSVGSIGVFMSNATRSGSTMANLVTNGDISVGNLTVKATTNQTITSEGMSVTIGLLAGTGETHRLGIDENVQTNVNGSGNTWNINGSLSIGAKSTNNATAQTSGAKPDQQDVSIAGLGVGFFKVDSAVNPKVSTSVSDVDLVVTGTSSMGVLANSTNHATAQSGSGSIVGGDAARAITDNSPSISLSTTNLTLTSASATFLAQNCGTYYTNADSVYATVVGGSAARAYNNSTPNLTLNLGTGTVITADGSVVVKAENKMIGLGDASNLKTSGIMARVGGGGFVSGFGGTSESCLTAGSAINLGDGVSIHTNGQGSNILIGSSQGWNTNQLTYMHDINYFAGGASVSSSVKSCLTNNILLGSDVSLSSTRGTVGIGTSINSQTTSDSYSQTFSTIGGSQNNADNTQKSCQTVTIGSNSILRAAGDISVTAGYDPVSRAGTLQDTYAIVTAHNKGLVSIPGTDASATTNSNMNVTIGSGSQIISDRDVDLGAIPGINNAQWYTFANMDGAKGKTHSGINGVTQTSNVTINGNVIAGYTHQLDINIPQSGTTASVNGQVVDLANISSSLTNVLPQNNSAFLPFQAAYQTNYNATQLLNGLDETSKLILSKSISTTPVKAITLANLTATGGQVLIHANTTLSGTGTISAFSPNITVTNNSPAYLLMDGVGIPNTLNMGKITVVGSAGLPVGMTLNQQLAKPSISINQFYSQAVGTGTTSGPAVAIIDPIVNTGGSVAIYNACGALVQDAPINTMTLSISTPNSAYIVNTPKSYLGTGGSISDYWMNSSQNLVQNSSFENPDLGSGSSSYQYNPQSPNWTFTGYSGLSGNGSGFTSGNPNAPAGSQVAFLQMTSVITQTISGLVAGQQYTVSFYAAQRKNYPNQSFNVTLGSTTLVSSLTPNSSNYQNYSYTFTPTSSANQTLTFTGLEPSGQDETVFLDQVIVTPSTTNITPGLNSYVYQYTANLAATTAANNLYLEQSKATNSTAFSNWLYNTGTNTGNNGVGVGGVDFVNTNVSAGNPGSLYPSKASNNWGTTEYGTGVIFFGSEIPYLWQNGSAIIAGGSSYLTSSLGYLDTLANAQYWSVAASGNPANSDLNVTQGTGPQNDNVNPGRGIYPAVPSNFPTSSSIANPQLATLGNGITAGQLDITALYIDINAPVNLGVNNTGFQANLSAALGTYIQSQLSGNTSCIPIPDSYLGGSNTELTAYYDVLANQIVLSPVAINAGVVSAIFKGGIISTTNQGKITVTSNPGQNLIDNQTGYPLVIQGIEAAESHLAGIVQFNDTLTNLSTAYVYRGNNVVQKYQGPLGPNNGANLSQLQLVSNTSATSATFAPASNLAYQWNQQAFISRNLSFTNDNNSYTLNASGSSGSTSPSAVNDNWSWGQLGSNGSAPGNYTSATNPFKVLNSFELTNGTNNTANAVWNPQKYEIPTSGNFTVQFTYQASGDKAADGIAFVFQNEGVNALGGTGGALGYVGISGNTAAYQINLYDDGGNHVPGSNFVTTNTSGYYNSTGNVSFPSGDPIQVNLLFNADNDTVTATLTDLNTNLTNVTVYNNVNLANLLGSQAYLGFTGGEGGATSIQKVSNFTMTGQNQIMSDFFSGVVSLTSPVTNYTQQISSQITQSETATTYFSSNYQDAWNFGPSTQWTWTYPTEILMQIKNQLPACNPIAIDFSGVQFGALNMNSDSSVILDGNIQFPGQVSITSGGNISQASGAVIVANQLTELTATGSIGTTSSPLNINLPMGSAVNAQAASGLYLSSDQSLTVGSVAASNSPVVIQSSVNIISSGTSTNVSGSSISLLAPYGSVGSQSQPITIHAVTTPLPTGSVTGGLLNASATDAVYVNQPNGDLRIGSMVTSSSNGTVSITTGNGNITDGNIPDAFELNTGKLSAAMIEHTIQSISLREANSANMAIAAFEGSVDSSYMQYWTALDNGTASNGTLTLSANGVLYYQPNANLYYANTANQTSNATVAQVNSYADMLYDNAISVFENNMAYGPGWASQSDFQTYNPNYNFTASNATISALTYQAADISNSFALLSLDALSPEGSQFLGNTTAPAIQTSQLFLKSSGSIGLSLDPVEIQLGSIQNGTLTPREKTLLALATNAGELQIVGNNVIVKIEKPLFVNVADNGQVQLNAGTSISLTETLGDMNIVNISTTGNVRLVAGSSINQVETGTTGSPVIAITANNLRLTSGDAIGSSTNPIAIQITGRLDSYSTSDLYLNQVSGDLLMGTIKASGTTQLNAQGSLYGTDNTIKGSIGNFGDTGTGWTVNSQNQTAGISQDVLTLGNAGSSGESSAWFNQPTVVVNSFIVSFIYQSQYSGNGLTFCIQNDARGTSAIGDSGAALGYGTNGINPQIQPSIAWQLNNGAAPNATQGVGLNRNGGYGMYQQTDPINFNSNHPIQVVLQYSSIDLEFTQTLTDTVTGEIFSSTVSSGINLYALLGDAKARFGFTGSGPAQTISNFYFSYGAPTISAGNLTLSSGGQIGTSSSPILMLATGTVNATAPNGIYLLQTDGDLYVNSISTQANVSLSAPTGSVVNSSSGSVQSSSLRSPSFGIHAASDPATGIKANHLQLDSLYGLGTANQPLTTQVNELSAINQFGDIVVSNTGPLAIGDGSAGNAIQTGRSVNITSDSAITVKSSVIAVEDIQLRGISGYLGGSRIHVNPGVSIASETGGVHLFGGDGVSIASGATVRSNSVVELYSNPIAGLNSTSPSLESRGQIVADNIRFNSSDIGTNLYLTLAGVRGVSTSPTVEFNAGSGFDTLTIDNRLDKTGLAVNIADGMIQTPNQKLILNAIDSVILELGDANDQVKIGDNLPLNQLQVFTNGGADTIETTLSKSTVLHQSFNGGTGLDSIKINGSGQNTWASSGLVQSWERTIQHSSTESISLSSATTVNAMPVATSPAIQQIPTGLGSNSRYIESTYQQVLNRLATPRELSRWSSMLDRNTITRLQLANKLTNSDEARLLRINAWFLNYFGRPATKQESNQALRRIRSGQSETRVLAGLLSNQEFFNRTQSLITTGFSRDLFITGLYKLAIDPSGTPSPALHRFLSQTWQTKGRTAVILNVLQSAPVARNQAEGLSILINQAPAQPQDVQIRLGQTRPSGVQALLLSRRSF